MSFDIRDFLDQLEPDGGRSDPRGDHSYQCPACGSNNFKVNVKTGKWAGFGCDCSTTERTYTGDVTTHTHTHTRLTLIRTLTLTRVLSLVPKHLHGSP